MLLTQKGAGPVSAPSGGARHTPEFSVRVGPPGPWLTVEVRGELDVATVPALTDTIGKLITPEHLPRIAMELSHLRFCDSSGINALVRLWKRVTAAGGELVLVAPRPRLAEALATTGLDRYLRIRDTMPEAPGA